MLDHITLTVESGGIGGFANITAKTPTVVFCLTFNTKGLSVYREGERITVERNGAVPKFVQTVRSVSFSARSAIKNGQKVLYITERCVHPHRPWPQAAGGLSRRGHAKGHPRPAAL